jgi:hypothetical protein
MTCSGKVTATWKAPARDGEILLWPAAKELIRATLENHRRLARADAVKIGGIPLSELRQRQRQWIGHDEDSPLVAAGHQVELLHPGVWAKDILINELARKVEGAAYHFAVDSDAPKHLHLRWPGGSMPITDDPRLGAAAWAGLLDAPTPRHVKELETAVGEASSHWSLEPMAREFLGSLRRGGMESSNLTWLLTNAIHRLDWELGLKHHAMLTAPLWASPGYLLFAHHILSRADCFAATYNALLAEYRRQQGIKNPGRPWPDLKITPEVCELPYWLDWVDEGRRQRACVVRGGRGWRLELSPGRAFELDSQNEGWESAERLGWFLSMGRARLAPRAVTLTAFLRLAVVDQFVHGIGGGRYDCVTDRVIERFFGIDPPAFSVSTATLLFPSALGAARIQLEPLIHEGRKLRHGDAREEKMRLVRQIEALPRNSLQRRQTFHEMHRWLRTLEAGQDYRDWEHRLEAAREMERRQQEIFDRELFYGIQPEARLRSLIEQYQEQFAQAG